MLRLFFKIFFFAEKYIKIIYIYIYININFKKIKFNKKNDSSLKKKDSIAFKATLFVFVF